MKQLIVEDQFISRDPVQTMSGSEIATSGVLIRPVTLTFPLVHHINHFPNPLSKSTRFTRKSP